MSEHSSGVSATRACYCMYLRSRLGMATSDVGVEDIDGDAVAAPEAAADELPRPSFFLRLVSMALTTLPGAVQQGKGGCHLSMVASY